MSNFILIILKWYGRFLSFTPNVITYKQKKIFQKVKFSKIHRDRYINLSISQITFYFPFFWKFLYYSQKISTLANNHISLNSFRKIIFLYSSCYFFFFPLPYYATQTAIDAQTASISFEFFRKNRFYGLFWTFFKRFFYQFTKVFFKKIKFKGKGYYAYKNKRNAFALQFGYSHIIRLYFYFIRAKFLAKTSIFIFGINQRNIFKASYLFFFIKPINIFTSRGIRFSKQIMYKKTGKISSYR